MHSLSIKIFIESLVFAFIVSLCDSYLLNHEVSTIKFFLWEVVYILGRLFTHHKIPSKKRSKRSLNNGYYALPLPNGRKKWMHFSALCWEMLFEKTGLTQTQIKEGYVPDKLEQNYARVCHVALYAFMAFDLEEGDKIDYQLFDVEEWMQVFGKISSQDFYRAMYWRKF